MVRDCGLYVDTFDPKDVAEAIKEAMGRPALEVRARGRVMETFPLEKRREEILQAVESLKSKFS